MLLQSLHRLGAAPTLSPESKFSVIIPTLQRSNLLTEVIAQCARHPDVGEVVVINNASNPLPIHDPKVRVLNQASNIFVNPAWNLGVAEAREPLVAILNDDIQFADEALTYAAALLRAGRFAVVAPDNSCLFAPETVGTGRPIGHRIASNDNLIFGTFMCMRKSDYVPVPPELKIWGGDHLQFWEQSRLNAVLINTPFRTVMNTTSGQPEFDPRRAEERPYIDQILKELYGRHWWHRPAKVVRAFRFTRARVKQALNR